MPPESMTIIISAVSGAIVSILGKWIISLFRYKSEKYQIEKRTDIEERKSAHEQIELLLESSEKYREEVRQDMIRMKAEMEKIKDAHEKEMGDFRGQYENQISSLKEQVATLVKEVELYRRENGALHLLLKNRGIEVPDWVRKET